MKIVLKFGGTSVGNGKKIINVCEIVQKVKKNNQVIVVSSALQSTTDELLELSEDAKKEQVKFMVISILNFKNSDIPLDASDALATALCHHQQFKINEL